MEIKAILNTGRRDAICCLADEILYTFLKPQACGIYLQGEIVVLAEDAYGDTVVRVRMLSEVMLELKMFYVINNILIELEKQFGTISTDQAFINWAKNCRLPAAMATHIKYLQYLNHLLHSVKKVPPIPDELK